MNNLTPHADRLCALRDERDDIKRVVRDIDGDIESAEQQLITEMRSSGTTKFAHAGYTYSLVTKLKATTLEGQKDRLCAALKKRGFEHLVYEAVNATNLSNFVEKQMAKNRNQLPKWLGSLVSAQEQTTLSVSKTKK